MKHGQEIPRKRIFQVFQAKNNRLIASGLQRFFPKLPKTWSARVPKCRFQNGLGFVLVFLKGRRSAPFERVVAVAVTFLRVYAQRLEDGVAAGIERAGQGIPVQPPGAEQDNHVHYHQVGFLLVTVGNNTLKT